MRASYLLPFVLLAACGGDTSRVPPAPPPATRPLAPAANAPPAEPKLLPRDAASGGGSWKYPATKMVDVSDTYFGKTYKDPFRLLENLKDTETAAWFKAQADLTDRVLETIPGRDALVQEWMALDKLKPATYGGFELHGGRLFYKKTLGGENVGKIFVRDGWSGAEQLLVDPAAYKSAVATAGATTTIGRFAPSWDGKYLAIAFSSGGAEYSEIRVLDVAKKTLLPESIYPSRAISGWSPDSRAFFYDTGAVTDIKSPSIELYRKTKLHKLGTATSDDADIIGNDSNPELGLEPKEWAEAWVDEHSPGYVVGNASTAEQEMKLYVAPISELGHPKVRWTPLSQPSDNLVRGWEFCGKDEVCAVTYSGAPHYKVVRTSLRHPDWAHAETVIPEALDTIRSITRSRSHLFVIYSNGIVGRIVKYDLATKRPSDVKLPEARIVDISCPDARSNRCIVWLGGWTHPTTLYELDADKDVVSKSTFNSDVTYPGFDALVAEEVEVPGHDGARIPLSIVHKKGIPLDGSSSCILDGYGAYGTSATPSFSVAQSVALRGVVLAFAHPRGGGEKGEAWYKAGFKTTKPNTWKDFISAAEYLVQEGYTSREKLAGRGTSAGGILISRAITERPDLFGAAVCNVGWANTMRTEFSPNGPANIPEFGSVTDPIGAASLFEMDGLQHVQSGVRYPAVLGVAGWNDPAWRRGQQGNSLLRSRGLVPQANPRP